MAVTIDIINLQKKILLRPQRISLIAQKILKSLKVPDACLSLAFVTDRKIQSINKKFLRHDYPTDVLAFDLRPNNPEGSAFNVQRSKKKTVLTAKRYALNAEVVISTETASRQAREFHTTPEYELILYLLHGILHLVGYDDHFPKETKRMRVKETELMNLLQKGIGRTSG